MFIESGITPNLIKFLSNANNNVQKLSLDILSHIAASKHKNFLIQKNNLLHLAELLNHDDEEIQKIAKLLLQKISSGSKKWKKTVSEAVGLLINLESDSD